MQSRLSKTTEKKTKKQLFLSLGGILIVLFLLIKFGIPALVNFSLFLSSFNNSNNPATNSSATQSIIQPPVLLSSFTATNSAAISVNGTAASNQTIQLYVNDSLFGSTSTKSDGSFSFSNVVLTQQQNTIKARAKQGNSLSDYSDPLTINYLQKSPDLTLDSPNDQQSFSGDQNTVVVRGKTDPDVQVTVNGFWAIVNTNGNYSYTFHLQDGDNHIDVTAVDAAGNKTDRQITLHYSH